MKWYCHTEWKWLPNLTSIHSWGNSSGVPWTSVTFKDKRGIYDNIENEKKMAHILGHKFLKFVRQMKREFYHF